MCGQIAFIFGILFLVVFFCVLSGVVDTDVTYGGVSIIHGRKINVDIVLY